MNLLHRITALILCIALSVMAFASNNAFASLESDIKNYQAQKSTLSQELEYTQSKRAEAQRKLTNLQMELKSKEIQLEKMKANLGKNPTTEQKEFISNESNRIELGETAIKSRKAAVTRLERKEKEIIKKIARADALTSKAQNKIASIEEQESSDTQAARSAKDYRIQRELNELRKENEQLRIAMAEEAQRTRDANEEAKRLEKLAIEKELVLRSIAEKKAEEARNLAEANTRNAETSSPKQQEVSNNKEVAEFEDPSQTVLPGEEPIYKRSDGKKVVIRNRGVRQSTIMEPVGNKVYRAEVVLEPGKSYFDVRKRRYRGYFPEKDGIATYVFYYDLSDKDQPILSVTRKSEDDIDQMISNAKDPF